MTRPEKLKSRTDEISPNPPKLAGTGRHHSSDTPSQCSSLFCSVPSGHVRGAFAALFYSIRLTARLQHVCAPITTDRVALGLYSSNSIKPLVSNSTLPQRTASHLPHTPRSPLQSLLSSKTHARHYPTLPQLRSSCPANAPWRPPSTFVSIPGTPIECCYNRYCTDIYHSS